MERLILILADTRVCVAVRDNDRVAFGELLTDAPEDKLCVALRDRVTVREGVTALEDVCVTLGEGPVPTLAVPVGVSVGELLVGDELAVPVFVWVALGLRRLWDDERLGVAPDDGTYPGLTLLEGERLTLFVTDGLRNVAITLALLDMLTVRLGER